MLNSYDINPCFNYSAILYLILLFSILIILFLIFRGRNKKKKTDKNIIITPPKNLGSIKNKYVNQLNDIEKRYQERKINSRRVYQELSILIRSFVKEIANIDVTAYTLKEIKQINIPPLTTLIEEYYTPEFYFLLIGNASLSLQKTKDVISKWN